MVLHLSPAEFLELGLDIVGFEQHRRQRTCIATKLRRFRAHFGVGPEAYSAIFTDLQTTDIDGARIDKPNPIHFFMTMNWLCTYKVEEELAGTFKVSEKTARKWIWKYKHLPMISGCTPRQPPIHQTSIILLGIGRMPNGF
jgi:hypothetical protein